MILENKNYIIVNYEKSRLLKQIIKPGGIVQISGNVHLSYCHNDISKNEMEKFIEWLEEFLVCYCDCVINKKDKSNSYLREHQIELKSLIENILSFTNKLTEFEFIFLNKLLNRKVPQEIYKDYNLDRNDAKEISISLANKISKELYQLLYYNTGYYEHGFNAKMGFKTDYNRISEQKYEISGCFVDRIFPDIDYKRYNEGSNSWTSTYLSRVIDNFLRVFYTKHSNYNPILFEKYYFMLHALIPIEPAYKKELKDGTIITRPTGEEQWLYPQKLDIYHQLCKPHEVKHGGYGRHWWITHYKPPMDNKLISWWIIESIIDDDNIINFIKIRNNKFDNQDVRKLIKNCLLKQNIGDKNYNLKITFERIKEIYLSLFNSENLFLTRCKNVDELDDLVIERINAMYHFIQ